MKIDNDPRGRYMPKVALEKIVVTAPILARAWSKYTAVFGEPPHGTEKQLAALFEFCKGVSK